MLRGVFGHFYAGKNVNIITQKNKTGTPDKVNKKVGTDIFVLYVQTQKIAFHRRAVQLRVSMYIYLFKVCPCCSSLLNHRKVFLAYS